MSKEVQAYRGITAGSGTATSEMRLLMIRIVQKTQNAHPTVVPSCFVDDLSAEMTGPDDHVLSELAGFVKNVAGSFVEAEMELSKTKSVCTASTESLGRKLEASLEDLSVTFEKTVKSLGVGLGAGVRRNTKVMAAIIRNLCARVHRFRMLKQLGFDTSMLLRTGGKQAMAYGLGIIGIADDMLRDMRRVAAAIAAPASGTGGQNLDAALIVVDGGAVAMC